MSEPNGAPLSNKSSMRKLHSSTPPGLHEDRTWSHRRRVHRNRRNNRSQCLTDDDIEEIRAGFELGFKFDSVQMDPKLVQSFPALRIYQSINKTNSDGTRTESGNGKRKTTTSESTEKEATKMVDLGDDPKAVKAKLKKWAKLVACSLQQQKSEVKIYSS